MKLLFAIAITLTCLYSCNNNPNQSENNIVESRPATPVINYAVTNFFPHDTSLYTEGLLVHNGQLFESTGSPEDHPQTKSVIGIIDLVTGKMDKKVEINKSKYFGEGIVIFGDKLYQLTYTSQVGFIYDVKSFKQVGQFSFANKQGWSLTTNGKELIMDDGTDKLTFLEPGNLKPVRILPVTENGLPVDKLNELEFIKGFIYANIWLTNFIVKIDPSNGKVVGRLDLTSLAFEAKNKYQEAEVLNGIAYDAAGDKIYVTGKLWPNIYQIEFEH
ncbi:MAG: glutaminyl-peptide cyclotransferase [Ferruginibacter sp.]